jgi:hypothetical protein
MIRKNDIYTFVDCTNIKCNYTDPTFSWKKFDYCNFEGVEGNCEYMRKVGTCPVGYA